MNRAPLGVPVDPDVKQTQTARSGFSSSFLGWNESERRSISNFSLFSVISIVSTEMPVGIPSDRSRVVITRSGSVISQIALRSKALRRGLTPAVTTPIFDAAI